MASNYKTLSAFEVATAEEAQSYFMDQVIVKVDTSADLTSLPTEVKSAYVLNTGILMARNVANEWVPMGGVAHVGETAPSNPQTGQLWVKPSERLPLPYRGYLLGTASSNVTATASGTQLPSSSTYAYTIDKAVMATVTLGGWMGTVAGAGTDVRARLAWTGATSGTSQDLLGGWHGVLMQGPSASGNTFSPYDHKGLTFNMVIPSGTTTFKVEAWKGTGSGTGGTFNYVGIEIVPTQWADAYLDGVS